MRRFDSASVPMPRGGAGVDVSSLLASGQALDIEVGCGVGLHPIRYAQAHPERTLIAIEHTSNKFQKFKGRLDHHPEIRNLHAVHADAVEWITHFVPDESVSRYFFLYPNPWPRPGDERRRWYAQPFMEKIMSSMKRGGMLELATNEAFYAEGARKYFIEIWGLELVDEKQIRLALEPEFRPRTHFEKKYLLRGETCFNLLLKK